MKRDLKDDKELIKRLLNEWHKSGKDQEISFVEWIEVNHEE
jgi:hypothetical protein